MKRQTDLQFKFEPIKPEYIVQAAKLIAQSYTQNPWVKNGFFNTQSVQISQIKVIQQFLQAQQIVNKRLGTNTHFCFVCRVEGKIIFAFTSCDYHYYVHQLLQKLGRSIYIEPMKSQFEKNPIKEGQCLYQGTIAVDPKWMSFGLSKLFYKQMAFYFVSKGYFGSYMFISNPIVFHILSKYHHIQTIKQLFCANEAKQIQIKFICRKLFKSVSHQFVETSNI